MTTDSTARARLRRVLHREFGRHLAAELRVEAVREPGELVLGRRDGEFELVLVDRRVDRDDDEEGAVVLQFDELQLLEANLGDARLRDQGDVVERPREDTGGESDPLFDLPGRLVELVEDAHLFLPRQFALPH